MIGGGFDFVETKIIADRAYKMFIKGDVDVLSGNDDDVIEIVDTVEVTEES